MKCVILAAGRGERMMPLTAETPKSMLKVNGKPIIDHILDALPEEIDEVIISVLYFGDRIKEHLSTRRGIKIKYVDGSSKGNVYSFLATKKYLENESFLLIYGDEIPNPVDIERCLESELSILTFDNGTYDGVMVLNTKIFGYKPADESFKTLLEKFVGYNNMKVDLIEAENFVGSINTPEDLERVNKIYG